MAENRKPGGQPGNQNGVKGRMWRNAIKAALEKRSESRADAQQALNDIAEQLINLASTGDMAALKELGDRIDGKAQSSIELSGDVDNPLCIIVRGDDAKL